MKSPNEYVADEAKTMLACLPEADRAAVEVWHAAEIRQARVQAVLRSSRLAGFHSGQTRRIRQTDQKKPAAIPNLALPSKPSIPVACPAPPAWRDVSPDVIRTGTKIEELVVGSTTCTRVTLGVDGTHQQTLTSCTEPR